MFTSPFFFVLNLSTTFNDSFSCLMLKNVKCVFFILILYLELCIERKMEYICITN